SARGVRRNRDEGRRRCRVNRTRADADLRRTVPSVLVMQGGALARETQFGPDVLSKGTRRGNHARFNLHLSRLHVQLTNQVVDGRDNRGNIPDDELIGTVIEQNVTASAEE